MNGQHYSLHDADVESVQFECSLVCLTFAFEALRVEYKFFDTRGFWGIDIDDVDDPLGGDVRELAINDKMGVQFETTHIHMQFYCSRFERSFSTL